MKKKIMSLGLVVALAAVTVVGGSLAYFTADDSAKNDFTVGNVDIEIVEEKWDAADATGAHENLYPGQVVEKDPVVVNNGANPAYVRVKITNTLSDTVRIQYTANENWKEHDGYYYYLGVVDAGGKTATPAIKEFKVLETTTNTTYADNVPDEAITIAADAVQAQGTTVTDPTNVTQLAAWFTTCGK